MDKAPVGASIEQSSQKWGRIGVCGSTISATRPVPVADDTTRIPVPDPRRKFLPTRPAAGIPVPVAYPYDYRTIRVKHMARGGTAKVTHPNVI